MRILHINLERGWRGGERQTLYLMEGLREIGYENHLLARKNEAFLHEALKSDLNVKTIHKPFLFHGNYLRNFDIIQTHEVRGLQLAAFWKFYHSRPLVFTRRVDNPPSEHPLTRYKYKQVDYLVTISDKIRSVMIDWGFPRDRITVIPSAINLGYQAQPARVDALRERFLGRKVIGCVASLEPRKDHATLLSAAAIINQKRPDVSFLLIGDGVLRTSLEDMAKRLGLGNIVFEGHQDDPYSYYPIFDVFLLTSKSEGLGSVILDAFSYRIPVVATESGGIPELVLKEHTGLLVPVGDPQKVAQALLRMLESRELRERCVSEAYRLLERNHSIPQLAKAYDEVYRGLTGTQ